MHTFVCARFDEAGLQKISRIQKQTGLNVSQILRRLIEVAEVKPLEVTAILSENAKSDATSQGLHVAFAN